MICSAQNLNLKNLYLDAGQFCWGFAKSWLSNKGCHELKSTFIDIPDKYVQDIDTIEDWKKAEERLNAQVRFLNKIKELDIKLESNVLIKVKNKYIFIDNQNQKISLVTESEFKSMNNYVVYDLSSKLLNKILMGPRFAHWNNAEIGSHIKFFRKPNIFERKLYNAMNYFHS